MNVVTMYNFGDRGAYQAMGTVPLYEVQLAATDWPEQTCKWVEFAHQNGLGVTYAAIPTRTKPHETLSQRMTRHGTCLDRLRQVLGKVPLVAILLNDEVRVTTDAEAEARLLEATVWTAVFKGAFPGVPLIRCYWSLAGLYDRRKGWEPGRYWDGKGPRDVVHTVCYYPDDWPSNVTQLVPAVQEARDESLPLAVTVSLGVAYDADQTGLQAVEYEVRASQAWAHVLRLLGVEWVWVHPSPGDERYASTMGPHLHEFLQEIKRK